MLTLSPATQIFLVAGYTDLRKSFNGLYSIVVNEIQESPLSGNLFLFCNRSRNRIKVLYWDGSGLWVMAKRLERGTFSWPETTARSLELSAEELTLLLGGIDLKGTKRRRWYRRRDEERWPEKLSRKNLNF